MAIKGNFCFRGTCWSSGGGHVTYREFVRQTLPKHRAQGHSNQDAMRAVARDWQRHKQSGAGLADDVSSIATVSVFVCWRWTKARGCKGSRGIGEAYGTLFFPPSQHESWFVYYNTVARRS